MSKERSAGLDLLRVIAVVCVSIMHLVSYSGWLNNGFRTPKYAVVSVIFYASKICIPLFLLLTGYLQCNKTYSRRFFAGIATVVVPTYFINILSAPLVFHFFSIKETTFSSLAMNVVNCSYGYSWYVEIYICLFLCIPFLNMMLERTTRRQHAVLMVIATALTMLPEVLQSFQVAGRWLDIIPDFFESLYPVAFFIIGAYIRKYQPKPNPLLCVGVGLAVILAEAALKFGYSVSGNAWWLFANAESLTHAIPGICVFLFFYRIKAFPRPLQWLVTDVAKCSFEMYLLYYPMDKIAYRFLPLPPVLCSAASIVGSYLVAKFLCLFLMPLCGWLIRVLSGEKQTAAAAKSA